MTQRYANLSLTDAIAVMTSSQLDLRLASELAFGYVVRIGEDAPLGLESDWVTMFQHGWLPADIGSGDNTYTYGELARQMLAYRVAYLDGEHRS